MNLWHRRLVYAGFAVIFLIAAPLIVFYTQGYRYNFKRGRVQKIGVLIVSSAPRRADIYLNNVFYNKKTPAKVEQLMPGDYEIKLTKSGYRDWQKKLTIYENATTFAEDVILWKNAMPELIQTMPITDWEISPDKEKIAFLDAGHNAYFLQLKDNKTFAIGHLPAGVNLKIIGWSNTGKKIILQAGNDFFLANAEACAVRCLAEPIAGQNYSALKWDLENDNTVYGLNQLGIWRLDLFSQKQELIASIINVSDFLADGEIIYALSDNILYRHILNSRDIKIMEKIKCAGCRFINQKSARLILLDQAEQNLFVVDPSRKNKTIATTGKGLDWLNNETILFYNDWEIWIYNFNQKNPELITRLGEKIKTALWHNEGRHIIFALDNAARVIELDDRELRNMTELAEPDAVSGLMLDAKGKNLYFPGQIGTSAGIYKLNIQ